MGKRADKYADDKFELEMTSMIDVVFLLLIFFMCATKFKIPEGTLDSFLPRDRGKSSTEIPPITLGCRVWLYPSALGDGEIVCEVDSEGVIIPQRPPAAADPFELATRNGVPGPDMEELQRYIRNRKDTYIGTGDKGLPVIIDFTPKVPVKYVIDVLNICKRLEIQDVAFAAPEVPLE